MLDENVIWQTQVGFFSTEVMDFVTDTPTEFVPLYSDTTDAENLVLADKAFLRQTVLFYGYGIPFALQSKLEKQEAIQAEYAPRLQSVLQAADAARLTNPDADTSALAAMYTDLRNEMRDKINEVPDDE